MFRYVRVSAESLRPQSFELFFPQLFFPRIYTRPPPPHPRPCHCGKAAAQRRQSTSTALVFSTVCFSRLSDPCGLSLDTNDSLLSLMPAVLAQGAQEKNRTGGH